MVGISHSYDHRLSVSKSNFNHLANRARVSNFLYKARERHRRGDASAEYDIILDSAQPSVQLGRGTPSVASEDNGHPSILSGIRRVVTVTKLFAEPPSSSDEENSPRLEADTPESSPTSSANSCASDGQSGGRNPLLQGIIAQKYAVQTLQLLQRFPDFAGKEEVRSLFEDIACFRGTVPNTP